MYHIHFLEVDMSTYVHCRPYKNLCRIIGKSGEEIHQSFFPCN